ncbi:MAG: hypothetical protein ACODAQ_09330 [Phycisphaeraceae bacterium]
MSKPLRIGQILLDQGVLNEQQVFEIVQEQQRLHLPFGLLAERMFDVTLESVEQAWVEQYHQATGTIDLSAQRFDERVLRLINRRQAWQFELLPVHIEASGELLVAASRQRLARAVTFVASRFSHPAYFRIADPDELRAYLQRYYPMPEVSKAVLERMRTMTAPTKRSA